MIQKNNNEGNKPAFKRGCFVLAMRFAIAGGRPGPSDPPARGRRADQEGSGPLLSRPLGVDEQQSHAPGSGRRHSFPATSTRLENTHTRGSVGPNGKI